MPGALDGKAALVTGGSSGIGRAVAHDLCSRGARVVITGRNRERGMEVERSTRPLGGDARFVEMNAASEASVRAAVDTVMDEFGTLDFLVNSAGYEGPLGPIVDLTEEVCDQLLAVNVKGPIMAAKHAIPRMLERPGSCIVNVSSFLGTIPFPLGPGYGATKAALLHLTRSIASAFGPQGIRCYAACPYITDTPLIDRVSGGNETVKQQLASMNPSGQMASAQDVARVIVDLLAGVLEVDEGTAVLIDAGGAISAPV